MLMLIARHEARLLRRSRAFWTSVALIVGVTIFGAANGAAWVRQQGETLAAIERNDADAYARIKAELADLTARGNPNPALTMGGLVWYILQPDGAPAPAPNLDPRRAESAGSEWVGARYAVLPPAPLGVLAIGQSDLHPYYSRVTIRTQPALIHSDEIENPVNLVSGRFDLAFVLTFCWPLLILPLTYELLSDERERGTLALVRSQPVLLRTLLLAKILVRGGSLVTVTILASIAAAIGFADVPLNSATIAGLAAWGALIGANGLLWFGLAVWVNSAAWRSGQNAMALTAAWLAWAVVIPAALSLAAPAFAPVPSRVQLINQVRAAGNLSSAELARLQATYLDEHADVAPAIGAFDGGAVRSLALQDETDRRIAPVLTQYHTSVVRQQRLVDRLRFASPVVLTYDMASELAGTSTTRYRLFASQLDAYHREWREYFYPLVHQHATLTAAHYDEAPRFTFREQPSRARVVGPLLTIALAGTVMLALGIRRLASYPVQP